MPLKSRDSHLPIRLVGQKRGRDAPHFAMQLSTLLYRFDSHSKIFLLVSSDRTAIVVLWPL
jgi:hypothetical protein